MATYVLYGYSTTSLPYNSGNGTFTLDPAFDYQTDRIRVEITDDDTFFDGDNASSPTFEEIGDDANQTATISLPDGTIIASGPVYVEGYHMLANSDYLDEIEIGGVLYGYLSTMDLQPGPTYSSSGYTDMADGSELEYSNYTSVLCFGPDCPIRTPRGALRAGDLRVGDLVDTFDAGPLPITAQLAFVGDGSGAQRGVRISAGALGGGLPRSEVTVSWSHRVLLRWGTATVLFGEREVLVPAGGLIDLPGVTLLQGPQDWVHLYVHPHHLLNSAGLWTESLLAAGALRLGKCGGNRIHLSGTAGGQAVRRCLTLRETQMLARLHRFGLRKKRVA